MGVAVGKDQRCALGGGAPLVERREVVLSGVGKVKGGRELSLGEDKAGKKSRVGCVSEMLRARMTVCLG